MKPFSRNRRGFLLLECMLAVAIFAMGVIALGRCVENCLKAERYRKEEGLAQRALMNYWIQIEVGAIPLAASAPAPEKLRGAWEGMTMQITQEPLTLTNETDQELFGLYSVKLLLSWDSGGSRNERTMDFIIFPRPQR